MADFVHARCASESGGFRQFRSGGTIDKTAVNIDAASHTVASDPFPLKFEFAPAAVVGGDVSYGVGPTSSGVSLCAGLA